MKSYFLSPVVSPSGAALALTTVLPGQSKPWVLKDSTGDAMAYFNVEKSGDGETTWGITVDISGRHYHCDAEVISILRALRRDTWGVISNDDWEVID
jgi:hypothetical protein